MLASRTLREHFARPVQGDTRVDATSFRVGPNRPLGRTKIGGRAHGDKDLATANTASNDVSILLNNGDGTFAAQVTYAAGDYSLAVAIEDLDGDGDADLAVANQYSDNVSVLLNNGDGTFPAQVTYAAGDFPRCVAIEDLDGDGEPDLAVANGDSDNVAVLLNQSACPGDIACDGDTDHADLGVLLGDWGCGT